MKWLIGNMDKLSFKIIKVFFESLKSRSQETKKPTTEKHKPKAKKSPTKKPFLFPSKGIPSTPQHTDSPPPAPDRGGPVACLGLVP